MIDVVKDGVNPKYMARLARVDENIINEYAISNSLKTVQNLGSKDHKFSIKDSRSIIRNTLLKKSLQVLKKKFAFYNFKGGVGKTSICFQLSSHIALMGYNVLVIDADPQAHI